jgi:hypothetical protein
LFNKCIASKKQLYTTFDYPEVNHKYQKVLGKNTRAVHKGSVDILDFHNLSLPNVIKKKRGKSVSKIRQIPTSDRCTILFTLLYR